MPKEVIDKVHNLAASETAKDVLDFDSTGSQSNSIDDSADYSTDDDSSGMDEDTDDDHDSDNDDDNAGNGNNDQRQGKNDEMTGVMDDTWEPGAPVQSKDHLITMGVDMPDPTASMIEPQPTDKVTSAESASAPDHRSAYQEQMEVRRSKRVLRAPQRLIETNMVNTIGDTITLVLEEHPNLLILSPDQAMKAFYKVVLTQYGVNKGLKVFGE
jgi:hypothetical protein